MARKPNAMVSGGGGGGWAAMNEKLAESRSSRQSGPAEFDMFGEVVKDPHGSLLGDEFIIPPFSVLNAREGWWQERKRKWLAIGIQSELGRGGDLIPNGGGASLAGSLRQGDR